MATITIQLMKIAEQGSEITYNRSRITDGDEEDVTDENSGSLWVEWS